MDPQLLDVLVCPLCKGKLLVRKQPLALVCPFDRLAYPVRDGIPVMLAEEAE
ncbi:Trm112 family protein, partial [Clostridium botulinum]|nr:Trm112 family protein [Clostridium botulinum]